MFESFFLNEDFRGKNHISKNHLSKKKHQTLFRGNEDVFVFDIERDPKDVVVSNYYHDKFRNGYVGDFSKYYWQSGRYVVDQLSSYHDMWRNAGPRSYVSSYERLQDDFSAEVIAIANILGVSLSEEDVEQLKVRTSLSSLRTEYKKDERYQGEKFFRKGEVGDWKNHFDEKMLLDVSHIISDGISKYDVHKCIRSLQEKFRKLL